MATEGYLLGYEEEYLAVEEVPRLSDRRAELMLGALVVAVVGLLVAMIVFVFIARAGRPSPTTASPGSARAGASTTSSQTIFHVGRDPRRRA